MSETDDTLHGAATNPGASRWARVVDAIMFSVWTPLTVCVFSIALIFTGTTLVIVQTRLAEIDLSRASGSVGGNPPNHQFAPTAYDFTLAPNELRAVTMDEARAFNAVLPFSTLPIQAARPFIMPPENLVDYSRALDCLTAAVYYEAAS